MPRQQYSFEDCELGEIKGNQTKRESLNESDLIDYIRSAYDNDLLHYQRYP